jgi:hypothetical protein
VGVNVAKTEMGIGKVSYLFVTLEKWLRWQNRDMDVFKKGVIAAFPAVMRWRRMQCCCCFGRCYGNPASLSMLGQVHTPDAAAMGLRP